MHASAPLHALSYAFNSRTYERFRRESVIASTKQLRYVTGLIELPTWKQTASNCKTVYLTKKHRRTRREAWTVRERGYNLISRHKSRMDCLGSDRECGIGIKEQYIRVRDMKG